MAIDLYNLPPELYAKVYSSDKIYSSDYEELNKDQKIAKKYVTDEVISVFQEDENLKEYTPKDVKNVSYSRSEDGNLLYVKADTNEDGKIDKKDKVIVSDRINKNRLINNADEDPNDKKQGQIEINKDGDDTKYILDLVGEKVLAQGDISVIGFDNEIELGDDSFFSPQKTNANVLITGKNLVSHSDKIVAKGEKTNVNIHATDEHSGPLVVNAKDEAKVNLKTEDEYTSVHATEKNGGKLKADCAPGGNYELEDDSDLLYKAGQGIKNFGKGILDGLKSLKFW